MVEARYFTPDSPAGQEALGGRLANACSAPCVIFLHGDLGTGKTTLVRGFLRALGYPGHVKSPSYSLLEPYELEGLSCYHLDLYRLGDPLELEYLGIRDLVQDKAILLVEWPEQGEGMLPRPDLAIDIRYRSDGRDVEVAARTAAGARALSRLGSA